MPDDRWRPAEGARVRVTPRDDALNPDGVWLVLSRSPEASTAWWVMPGDDAARAWVADHPREVVSGCVSVLGNRLESTRTVRTT